MGKSPWDLPPTDANLGPQYIFIPRLSDAAEKTAKVTSAFAGKHLSVSDRACRAPLGLIIQTIQEIQALDMEASHLLLHW